MIGWNRNYPLGHIHQPIAVDVKDRLERLPPQRCSVCTVKAGGNGRSGTDNHPCLVHGDQCIFGEDVITPHTRDRHKHRVVEFLFKKVALNAMRGLCQQLLPKQIIRAIAPIDRDKIDCTNHPPVGIQHRNAGTGELSERRKVMIRTAHSDCVPRSQGHGYAVCAGHAFVPT